MMEEMFVAVEQSKPRRSALWEEQKSVEVVVGRPSNTDYGGRTAVHGSVSAAWATTQ